MKRVYYRKWGESEPPVESTAVRWAARLVYCVLCALKASV